MKTLLTIALLIVAVPVLRGAAYVAQVIVEYFRGR